MRYQLLGLDVDGTLFDPDGELRPSVCQAVAAAQARGVRVTLCTGRRFRTARPVAATLGITMPLVVHNGALIKEPGSGNTLWHTYLPENVYNQGIALLRQVSSPMVYIDAFHEHVDIVTAPIDTAHPFQQEYLQDNLEHCRIVDDIDTSPLHSTVMMSIMADVSSLHALRGTIETTLGDQARVNVLANKSYRGQILEILHPTVTKWQALEQLATQEGIAPEHIMVVGDDWNDLEMIRHAGLGVAMGNAHDDIKAAADHVTGSNAEDGLVQAIERFVLHSAGA